MNNLPELEENFVVNTYSKISDDFSKTRYSVWSFVKDFLENKANLGLGLDLGCGNGKNMILDNMIGVDVNESFVDICKLRNKKVILSDCCNVPFLDNTFDFCICISMIHHLSTKERRKQCMVEIIRIMKPDSECIINVWSLENQSKRSFQVGDNIVEWKFKDLSRFPEKRYYYIMNYDMFMEEIVSPYLNFLKVINIKNEKGNWILHFKKI